MPKTKQTPGTALNALLKKHGLNYNRLAKAIGLSSAMVRLIARDENPVSASVAFRLAKFFKAKPEYWLALQMDFDNAKAAGDKKLAKALKDIPTVDKATFERKPRTTKAKSAKKGKPAGKSARGRKAAAKPKAASKKIALKKAPLKSAKKTSVKRGKSAPSAKPSKKTTVRAVKAPVVKKAPPIITVRPEPKPVSVQPVSQSQPQPQSQPSVPSNTTINEPQI